MRLILSSIVSNCFHWFGESILSVARQPRSRCSSLSLSRVYAWLTRSCGSRLESHLRLYHELAKMRIFQTDSVHEAVIDPIQRTRKVLQRICVALRTKTEIKRKKETETSKHGKQKHGLLNPRKGERMSSKKREKGIHAGTTPRRKRNR